MRIYKNSPQNIAIKSEKIQYFGHISRKCAAALGLIRSHVQITRRVTILKRIANKGFWADLLGIGDFYYELGIQIAEICLATRDRNGGLLSFSDLQTFLQANRQAQAEITECVSKNHQHI